MLRKPRETLDLTQVEIVPFSNSLTHNTFYCGKRPIDQFLKNKAHKASKRHEHRVFVACLAGSKRIIGYYALQVGSDSVADLPTPFKNNNYLNNNSYVAFPAINLAFLGVHENYQRQGLGAYLLMDVFEKAAIIAQHAGFYALTLTSFDSASTKFYESLKFTTYTDGSQPKMLMPIGTILELTGRTL